MTSDPLTQNTLSLAPSLYGENTPLRLDQSPQPRTLADLLHDGFYMLLLLRNRYLPNDADRFALDVRRLLDSFERNARRMNMPLDDIYAAKYAFCATVDEAILSSDMPIRATWEQSPLQLTLFGDQLAGEHFYTELEQVRLRGSTGLQALEVFYMCLLIGFQGKYMLDGKEKLNYLIASLGKEIAHLKGKHAQFAPHWKSPDNVRHLMKAEVPMWIVGAALAVIAISAYTALNWFLARHTNAVLGDYFDIIKLAPKLANITISLP